ncbi:unnamed protein product [Linum trigynum]|uniref:Protein-serine/threonine phosphatase n=1 Tax=Linum trigynum TaxID=586398 RepID=A0AAV2FLB3_9ROSI
MEDAVAVAVEPGFTVGEYNFFWVYDGHGEAGMAEACKERLHELLAEEIGVAAATGGGGTGWGGVMGRCFERMDGMVEKKVGWWGRLRWWPWSGRRWWWWPIPAPIIFLVCD